MEVLMCVDTTRDNSFSLCHGGNAIPSSEVVRVGTHGRATDKTVIGLRHELLLGHVRQAGCAGVALLTRSTNRFKDTEKGPPVGWVKPGERGHANLLACLLPRLVDPLQVRGSPQRHSHSSRESRAAYDKAIELAGNTAETAYLTRRRDELA